MPTPSRLPEGLSPRLGLATACGLIAVLCFAPFGLFWLAPLPSLGLFLLLRQAPNCREAALTGFAYGAAFFSAGVSWIFVSLSVFGGMPFWLAGPATLLFCLAMALYPALAGVLFKRWQPASSFAQATLFAALMAAVDWLRSWFLTGFPWLLTGYAQASPSPLAGFAPLLGVHGIGFLVLLCSALLLQWRVGLLAFALTLALGAGLRQIEWTQPDGAPISVALIQGNVPQEMKFRPEAFHKTLRHYLDLIEGHPAQLTVLPETAIPAFFDQLPEDYTQALDRLARRRQGDLLIGSVLGDGTHYWNSAVSLGHSPSQSYRKSHLVPFGETIPPGFAWFMAMANIPMSSFSAGPEIQPPLLIAGQRLAVNICYEDVFGEEIRRNVPPAGILVNLSNTAWFGDSLAQPQHLQIAQMRAAETGRPMLRATNTGMTAAIGPDGRIQSVLPPFTTAVLKTEVQAYQGLTPYVRFGNLPVLILVFGLIGFIVGRSKTARHLAPSQ